MGFDGQEPTKQEIRSLAQYAENLGYDSLSVNDHVVFHTRWLDAISSLSAVSTSTSKIKLGTSILNIVVRNPVVSAKALAAIDILSSGRLFVGIGAGSYRGDYKACGIPFEDRLPRFSEALEILISLLDNNMITLSPSATKVNTMILKRFHCRLDQCRDRVHQYTLVVGDLIQG